MDICLHQEPWISKSTPLQDKTFKDPQRLVQSQAGPEGNQVLQRLRDKPFWLVDGVRKPRLILRKGIQAAGKWLS